MHNFVALSYRPDWWAKRCPIFVKICLYDVYIWYIWYCNCMWYHRGLRVANDRCAPPQYTAMYKSRGKCVPSPKLLMEIQRLGTREQDRHLSALCAMAIHDLQHLRDKLCVLKRNTHVARITSTDTTFSKRLNLSLLHSVSFHGAGSPYLAGARDTQAPNLKWNACGISISVVWKLRPERKPETKHTPQITDKKSADKTLKLWNVRVS